MRRFIMAKQAKWILSIAALISLSACTTPGAHMIPDGEMSMSQIYKNTLASSANNVSDDGYQQHSNSPVVNYTGYTSDNRNELKSLFKVVHNPQIPIYIYPHLVKVGDEDLPKPGYSSAFFLYKKSQFALPSERY